MPIFRLPRDSGPHRIAAIALYRALLSQCRALVSVEARQRDELQNVVRNRFKQARHEHSTRRLRLGFEAGYEAIDYLDAAVAGEEQSKSYILDLLSRAPDKVKQPPPLTPLQTRLIEQKERAAAASKQEPKPSILDRPLPLDQLRGKRHVPHLFSAQGIPVLRIKKPIPENLSGYLNHRLQRKQKWHDTRQRLEEEVELAKREDEWDGIVSRFVRRGVEGARREEMPWGYEHAMARNGIHDKLNRESARNREMGVRMQGVVDREQEMFDAEKLERKKAKRRAYVERREARRAVATDDSTIAGSQT